MTFRDMLVMLVLAAVWGGSFLFLHVAAPVVGPVGLAAFRVSSAALLLLPIVLSKGEGRLLLTHFRPLLVCGVLAFGLPFICLSLAGLVPLWIVGLVLFRDLVIFFGALTYKWLFGPLHGEPTAVSKLNTLCQILFCLAVVANAAFGWPGEPAVIALGALVLVSTAVSGIDYTLTYTRRASAVTRERTAATG